MSNRELYTKAKHKATIRTKPTITFEQLDTFLRQVGFLSIPTEGQHLLYENAASGAMIILPPYQPTDPVRPTHLIAVEQLLPNEELSLHKSFSASSLQH